MERKKEFHFFTVFEYEKEQTYLRRMQQRGWRFVQVSGLGMYHFEKCSPEDVIYQLDYNPEGLANRDEYVKMFQDCGWEYLQDYVGYSYFRKPAAETGGTEEIFCDDSSRLQMMERVFRGRMLPLLALLFGVLLPGLLRSISQKQWFVAGINGAVILLYLILFGVFACQYFSFRRKS